jgi:hypothetical protein
MAPTAGLPSASEIASATSVTPVRLEHATAANAAAMPAPPYGASTSARTWKTASATDVQSANRLTLNAAFSGRCRRWTRSAAAPPQTCAATSPSGDVQKRPTTTPNSLRESVCASLRKWRWTTWASAT